MSTTNARTDISNQFPDWTDYNLLATDPALQASLAHAGVDWAEPMLKVYAQQLGHAQTFELAGLANRHTPELHSFDTRGQRISSVEFHPAWHALLGMYRERGLVSLPFENPAQKGRWTAWAAGFYLHGQIEQGTLCPATMTQASIPLIAREPALWAALGGKLMSHAYDARDVPITEKASLWIGMGMTERQGGSDVRANTTLAVPLDAGGRCGAYRINGHKWFYSAPMSDAHLVVARLSQEDGPLGCFFVPRWRDDGKLNAVHVQRLKDKVGNRSNSSSEVEFVDAIGTLIGEEGRGIPTIIEMATYTRLNCVLGSAAMLRSALVQALAYTRRRSAFGKHLAEQPLMRSVLADLALESEAALALSMRLAQAYEDEDAGSDPLARAWKRVMTPAAKFWVCKRGVELSGEAMEVFGGNGYVNESLVARLFREAPVNSIWEGSGNVMCLDVLRALSRERDALEQLYADFSNAALDEPRIAKALRELHALFTAPPDQLEGIARLLVQRLVLIAQACLLKRHAPAFVADAFIATRLASPTGINGVVGAIDVRGLDVDAILERALPQ
ncbi:acyl-CoA dehydrogenase family protein [Diaphorobacter caeni]|uniref:acyl-CoA dehydrogenase family protein n=1 Tax=Diaphorobacter caeni TaxID=2784387 RepID=UPI0018902503|nr:acyl-CoA dehydrogenase family protein [Diaphorobacter caeni]MBF5005252.1 acyl-CoA dehydrogenase family protein [Diaphorobacter caeni]